MTASTCSAIEPLARWGRWSTIARAMSARPRPRSFANFGSAFGQFLAPKVLLVGMDRPPIFAFTSDQKIPTEPIGVGQAQRCLLAMQFDRRNAVFPNVPTRHERHMGVGYKIKQRMDIGERLDLDRLAAHRRSGRRHDAFGEADLARRLDRGDGSEERDQRRQIVGAHVEDRSGAGAEEEAGVRMPMLHAVRHHGG